MVTKTLPAVSVGPPPGQASTTGRSPATPAGHSSGEINKIMKIIIPQHPEEFLKEKEHQNARGKGNARLMRR